MSLSCNHWPVPYPNCAICICAHERMRRQNSHAKAMPTKKSRTIRQGQQSPDVYSIAAGAVNDEKILDTIKGKERQAGMSAALGIGYTATPMKTPTFEQAVAAEHRKAMAKEARNIFLGLAGLMVMLLVVFLTWVALKGTV